MRSKKVLIYDDNKDNLDILELILKSEGFIEIKENNSTVLRDKILENCPDVILIDL